MATLASAAGFSPRYFLGSIPSTSMMGSFPDDMHFIIVDDLFLHYDVMYDDRKDVVYVDCNRCDDVVATLPYSEVVEMGELDLYEYIIESHRKI